MEIRRFEDVVEFNEQVEAFLLQKEAEHCLLLGNLSTLIHSDIYREPPYMAYVEQDGAVVAVALRTPPYNLVISEIDVSNKQNVVAAIANDALQVYETLPGVLAPKGISKAFAENWQRLTGQAFHPGLAERIYKLQIVKHVDGVRGEMRIPTDDDRELRIEWMMAFAAEALEPNTREQAERIVDVRMSSDPAMRGLRLWWDGDKAVSLAGYAGLTPHGIRVGPVYTPREARKQGYASALVSVMSQELLDRGRQFCFLFTDLSNPTSNHIYQTIGYEPVSDVDEYRFDEGQA